MAGENTSAYGVYPDRAKLENGVQALRDADFRSEDISVLLPENLGSKDFSRLRNKARDRKASRVEPPASQPSTTGHHPGGIGAITLPVLVRFFGRSQRGLQRAPKATGAH